MGITDLFANSSNLYKRMRYSRSSELISGGIECSRGGWKVFSCYNPHFDTLLLFASSFYARLKFYAMMGSNGFPLIKA